LPRHRKQPREDDGDRKPRGERGGGRKRRKRNDTRDESDRLPSGFGPFPDIEDDLGEFDDDFDPEFDGEEDIDFDDYGDVDDAPDDDSER
jgi:hypothetical protein